MRSTPARPPLTEHIDSYFVPPGLGARAGVMGALELARMAYVTHGDRSLPVAGTPHD